MSLILYTDASCPRCHGPIAHTTIDLHPTLSGVAISKFKCTDCGEVKSKTYSLRSRKPSSGLTA